MKKSISEIASDKLGIPKDVIMNLPCITVSGDREIYIENHKGLLGYTDTQISVSTHIGIVTIQGKDLCIERIRLEDILVSGRFSCVKYEK